MCSRVRGPVALLVFLLVPAVALARPVPRYRYLTQWGNAGAGNGQFNLPVGVAADGAGRVFVTDYGNARVEVFNSDGVYLTQWNGAGSEGGAFRAPAAVAIGEGGNVVVADYQAQRVHLFSPGGTYVAGWGSLGSGAGQFFQAFGVAVGPSGVVYVADKFNDRIQAFTSSGSFLFQFGNSHPWQPQSVAVDAHGTVFVGAWPGVWVFASDGSYVTRWGTELDARGLAVDPEGRVFVANAFNDRVDVFEADGTYLASVGLPGTGTGQLDNPTAVCFDAAGNLYVTDTNNYRVQKFGFGPVAVGRDTWGRLKRLYRK